MKRLSTHEAAGRQPASPSPGTRRSAALCALTLARLVMPAALLVAACAPEKARVKDSVTTPGAFEGYAIVMKLPAQSAAGATGGTSTTTSGSATGRPALHVCFQMGQGSTLSAERNEYDCRFYEYFERAGKWAMSSEVFNEKGPGAGAAGTCSFGGGAAGPQLPFTCKRVAADKSVSSCSVFNEFLLDAARQGPSFASVSMAGAAPTIVPTAATGASVAGPPLPTPTEVAIVKGRCGEATMTGLSPTLQFNMPAADQLVASQGSAPAPAAAGTVKFKALQTTSLKYATGQSAPMTPGSQKCDVAAGAVVTGKTLGGGTPTPDGTKHYALTGISVEPKPSGCTLLDSSSATIYLFAQHWSIAP